MTLLSSYSPKSSLKTLSIISCLLTSLLGVLFHFVYEWSGNQLLLGLFFPVNESVWEHLKLIFFPLLFVSCLEYFISHPQKSDFVCIKLRSALLGMLTVVILFYTYTGILGTVIDWLNIVLYFVAVAITYLYSYHKLSSNTTLACNPNLNLLFIFSITILFMIFTIYPPNLGIFQAP